MRTCVRACVRTCGLPMHVVHKPPIPSHGPPHSSQGISHESARFLSCSHAVFAFCCFSAFPRTVPRLLFRRYSRQQVKFAFLPHVGRQGAKWTIEDVMASVYLLRGTVFGTCDCGDETPRGTVYLCRGGISARINYEITYLGTYSKKHFGIQYTV